MSLETMTKLASVTVTAVGGQASIDFTNIPQGYTDLVVKLSARSAGTDGDSFFTINGSSSNFTYRRLEGSGSSVTSANGTAGFWANITASNQTASTFANVEVYFSNYSGSNYKSYSSESVAENNATLSYSRVIAGLWSNSAPITSLSFSTYGANLAQYTTATLYGVKNARQTAGNSIKATGGNIVFDGTYVYHVFNSTGAFVPTTSLTCDYVVVAGGGAGGNSDVNNVAGGGGAGGYRTSLGGSALSVLPTSYAVTVGAGGAMGSTGANGGNGTSSSFSTINTTGGGGGGGSPAATGVLPGSSGGSGGGGGDTNSGNQVGGSGNAGGYSPVEGYAGGNCAASSAGGGGGAGGVGSNGSGASSYLGGAGGTGATNAILNALSIGQLSNGNYYVAGGGGGGAETTGGTAGLGGGGKGGQNSGGVGRLGVLGTANTGGGGGGSRASGSGGPNTGGSGIVIIRYKG